MVKAVDPQIGRGVDGDGVAADRDLRGIGHVNGPCISCILAVGDHDIARAYRDGLAKGQHDIAVNRYIGAIIGWRAAGQGGHNRINRDGWGGVSCNTGVTSSIRVTGAHSDACCDC